MRADYQSFMPKALKGMLGIEEALRGSSLEPELLELVKLRASQINGSPTALACTARTRARGERTSSDFICLPPGSERYSVFGPYTWSAASMARMECAKAPLARISATTQIASIKCFAPFRQLRGRVGKDGGSHAFLLGIGCPEQTGLLHMFAASQGRDSLSA